MKKSIETNKGRTTSFQAKAIWTLAWHITPFASQQVELKFDSVKIVDYK